MERRQQVRHPQPGRKLNGTNSLGLPAELNASPGISPPSSGMRVAASVNYKAMNEVYQLDESVQVRVIIPFLITLSYNPFL